MLHADPVTYDSVKRLWGLSRSTTKPILIWVGAGASSWLGYERWPDLAARFHRVFVRNHSVYARAEAARELAEGKYPAVFQRCRDADTQAYFSLLANSFPPRLITPTYERFINAVNALERCSVITTNVDEVLERSLPAFELVQRSDLSRTLSLATSGVRFIGKLHGSISAVQSTVFAQQDYDAIVNDKSFVDPLRSLLTTCSVVFIGYSLRDKYLFDLLEQNASSLSLFGDGPHFIVSSEDLSDVPPSVKLIRYRADFHTDHRSAILVVELLRRPEAEAEPVTYKRPVEAELQSAHFLSDFYPGGTWTVSNRLQLACEDGAQREMLVGPDWSIEEIPSRGSTAGSDLAVGLICFDRIFLDIECISRVAQLVGPELFLRLTGDDILRLVQWEGYDGVMFTKGNCGFGHLATGNLLGQTAIRSIRRQLSAVAGREAEFTRVIERLESKITQADLSGTLNFADVCNGLLVSPSTRSLLGISEATPVGHIPRWCAALALRLVQIARVGATCQTLNLSSMQLMPGAAQVAQVAFSSVAGGALAREAANYTLVGHYGAIPPQTFADPGVWSAILRFRESNAGTNLRAAINRYLAKNEGAEIVGSLDAGLRQALPASILESARREMSTLLVASATPLKVTPGIWMDGPGVWNGPAAWRRRAKKRLDEYLQDQKLSPYDLCPCGSYEAVKFCCRSALSG